MKVTLQLKTRRRCPTSSSTTNNYFHSMFNPSFSQEEYNNHSSSTTSSCDPITDINVSCDHKSLNTVRVSSGWNISNISPIHKCAHKNMKLQIIGPSPNSPLYQRCGSVYMQSTNKPSFLSIARYRIRIHQGRVHNVKVIAPISY